MKLLTHNKRVKQFTHKVVGGGISSCYSSLFQWLYRTTKLLRGNYLFQCEWEA